MAGPGRRRAQPARPGGHPARGDRRHHGRAGAARRARGPAPPAVDAHPHRPHPVVRAGADQGTRRSRLRLRRPHGVPAAQHAGRCRRHARRRARRPPAIAAALGGHDARRDVRPRHQPDGAGHRPDGGHRRQPRGGVPGPAVRQGARSGRGGDRRPERPDHRRAALAHRPPRCRRRLGDGRPLAVRRQPGDGGAEGEHGRRRTCWRSRPARVEEFPHGDDWTALAAVGPHGDLVGRRVADLDVGSPSTWTAHLDQAELFGDLPTDDGELPLVLAGSVDRPASTATSRRSCSPP